jgi:hypothetical protein
MYQKVNKQSKTVNLGHHPNARETATGVNRDLGIFKLSE